MHNERISIVFDLQKQLLSSIAEYVLACNSILNSNTFWLDQWSGFPLILNNDIMFMKKSYDSLGHRFTIDNEFSRRKIDSKTAIIIKNDWKI